MTQDAGEIVVVVVFIKSNEVENETENRHFVDVDFLRVICFYAIFFKLVLYAGHGIVVRYANRGVERPESFHV